MFTYVAVLTLAIAGPRPLAVPRTDRPTVKVWTNRGESPYASGEAVRVMFQTEQDAYVTVLQVDTDGRVRVLFPREPWENTFARGGRAYDIPDAGAPSGFRADAYPGQGYLFAVAATEPFSYDEIASDQRWNYGLIADAGRIRGDPYAALTELAARFVPESNGGWDYDITPYYVQRHYDYPRFLCYDCHTYVGLQTWNPYDYSCVRFRVVVFNDPYYYPYRWYGGTKTAFRRPLRPEPRFIFRDRRASDAFITRVGERPVNDTRRRDVGVRGRDIGGLGTVPLARTITRHELLNVPDRHDDATRGVSRARAGRPDRAAYGAWQGKQDTARRKPSAAPRRPDTGSARPRQPPRAEPASGGDRDHGKRSEPELRRRKP